MVIIIIILLISLAMNIIYLSASEFHEKKGMVFQCQYLREGNMILSNNGVSTIIKRRAS